MRKMFSLMMTSADGYHADPAQALDCITSTRSSASSRWRSFARPARWCSAA